MRKRLTVLWQKITHVSAKENSVAVFGNLTGSVTINQRDSEDLALIDYLMSHNQSLIAENNELKEQIKPAVIGLSNLDESQQDIEGARAALAKGDTNKAKALYRQAARKTVDEGKGRFRQAAEYYKRLGALAYLDDTKEALSAYLRATELDSSNPDAWNQLGHLYRRVGELTKSIIAYETILALPKDKSSRWVAVAHGNLGIVYQERGELDRAVEMFEKSLTICDALGLQENVANVYGNLGNVYRTRGELDRAVEAYEKSLAICEALGLEGSMAILYGNLGNVYQNQGELDRAVEIVEKALTICEALGLQESKANQYARLGSIYMIRGELDRAVNMFENTLTISKALGLQGITADTYTCLGIVYKERGELDRAVEAYEKSLAINEAVGLQEGAAIAHANLGNIYLIRSELDRARASLERAAKLFETIGSPHAATVRSSIDELDTESTSF